MSELEFTKEEVERARGMMQAFGVSNDEPFVEDGAINPIADIVILKEERRVARNTLNGVEMIDEVRYVLAHYETVSGYPHEPDSVELIEHDHYASLYDALASALLMAYEWEINAYIESARWLAYDESAEEAL